MEKYFVIAIVAALAAAPVQAGLFDSVATSGWQDVTPDAKYNLEVYGFDARVYEWTLKTDPNVLCTAMFSERGPVGYQCVRKDNNANGE